MTNQNRRTLLKSTGAIVLGAVGSRLLLPKHAYANSTKGQHVQGDFGPSTPEDVEHRWYSHIIPATGWHGVHIPVGTRRLLVYVSDIDWTNPHKRYKTLGGPGEENAVLFGPHNGITIWVTSTDKAKPSQYFSSRVLPTYFTTTVNDHYAQDNKGTYTIHFKPINPEEAKIAG